MKGRPIKVRARISKGMRRSWAERKARRVVYLAGNMTKSTSEQARSWRRKVTNVLKRARVHLPRPHLAGQRHGAR